MEREIVKAELLWTRVCPLRCQHCTMIDGRFNTKPLEFWYDGIDNLKKLGCGFIAFYGAEPLYDFNKLPEVVGYAEKNGIHTTVITSGMVKDLDWKLRELITHGSKSLSMSYDMTGLDKSSILKTNKAVETLLRFRELSEGNNRDVAAIATLTRRNFKLLPEMVKRMTELGIWSFFDIIHYDRGQENSKCASRQVIEPDLFTYDDLDALKSVFGEFRKLKNEGYLCHSSDYFLDMLEKDNFSLLFNYSWDCAKETCFPSWVTCDVDGRVFPCDDRQDRDGYDIYLNQLYSKWEEYTMYWKQRLNAKPCPCSWNTHIDATAIKLGKVSFSDYVHI